MSLVANVLADLAVKKSERDHTMYLPGDPQPDARVPCGTCKACCTNNQAIFLSNHDDWENYETEIDEGADLGGLKMRVLKHKENGDCIYLGDNGCTIHGHAPHVCRTFDCRLACLRYKDDPRFSALKDNLFKVGKKMLREHPVKG